MLSLALASASPNRDVERYRDPRPLGGKRMCASGCRHIPSLRGLHPRQGRRYRIESVISIDRHDLGEDRLERVGIARAKAAKIDVPGFAIVMIELLSDEHPAFQNIPLAISRLRSPEEQALEGEADQQDIEDTASAA